jgi:hypothetical protein
MKSLLPVLPASLLICSFSCSDDAGTGGGGGSAPTMTFTVVTFNTGTTEGLDHDAPPDDGYGSAQAAISDMYYGDGLAWPRALEDARVFFAVASPDIVAVQEMFHSAECEAIPVEQRAGFVCETWQAGDPTVIQTMLGPDYQIGCHLGKADKCIAVHRRFGTLRGCAEGLCLDGLAGAEVEGCGGGSRVGRAVIDLVGGGSLTVVNVHGTSGITDQDLACRQRQFEQLFVDLGIGDGPAANGAHNVILGDLNTDPARLADFDPSAELFLSHVGKGKRFHFVTEAGPEATPTYGGVNIDHVVSDRFEGTCWHAGITEGHPPVTDMTYFDHKPAVCILSG